MLDVLERELAGRSIIQSMRGARQFAWMTGIPMHILLLTILVSLPSAASGWQTRITGAGAGSGAALSVRADSMGDVVAAGFIDDGSSGADFAVVKLAGATGTELWRQVLIGPGTDDRAVDVAFDAAGNAVVTGTTSALGGDQFTVAKLASGDGHVLWRTEVTTGFQGLAVIVDRAGDVVAGGSGAVTVVKLDGATGAEKWRSGIPIGPLQGTVYALAADANNDIVATGVINEGRLFGSVVKLASATGNQIWGRDVSGNRVVIDSLDAILGEGDYFSGGVTALSLTDGTTHWAASLPGPVFGLELGPTGDIVVGSQGVGAQVSALAATDGTQLWARTFAPYVVQEGSVAVDASGNVVFAGTLTDHWGNDLFPGFTAALIAGADGTELWQRSDNGAAVPGSFIVHDLAVAGMSRVVVAGAGRSTPDGPTAFTLLGLSSNDGALDLCGDGYRDAGEQCDDGNLVGDDCCSADCQTMGRDGQVCAPSTACTIDATCHGGTCSGRPLPCEPCGSCDPVAGCHAAFADGCRRPTATQRAILDLRRRARRKGDALMWAWTSGAATAKADFGDPRTQSGYALCLYTSDGSQVIDVMNAPAGGQCGRGSPCWHATRQGVTFQSTRGKPDGLTSAVLKSGNAGRARIVVRGKGSNLRLPALPLSSGVAVQLRRSDGTGACWGAEHDFIVRNRSNRYTAKGN
jgi:cysteine-rich repeat protein